MLPVANRLEILDGLFAASSIVKDWQGLKSNPWLHSRKSGHYFCQNPQSFLILTSLSKMNNRK